MVARLQSGGSDPPRPEGGRCASGPRPDLEKPCRADPGGPGRASVGILAIEPDLTPRLGIHADPVIVAPAIAAEAVQAQIVGNSRFEQQARLKLTQRVCSAATSEEDRGELFG